VEIAPYTRSCVAAREPDGRFHDVEHGRGVVQIPKQLIDRRQNDVTALDQGFGV
jgi:DNA uptake protein ComE-like DNA-binding protein